MCYDFQSNEEYIECEAEYDLIYSSCILSCPNADLVCIAACSRDYNNNIENCPCKESLEINNVYVLVSVNSSSKVE